LANYGSQLNCQECDEKLKKERGHFEKGIIPFFFDSEMVYRCPISLISGISWEYIKAFSFYEKGFLPNGNAWGGESNKFNQALTIMENSFHEARNSEIKNARR